MPARNVFVSLALRSNKWWRTKKCTGATGRVFLEAEYVGRRPVISTVRVTYEPNTTGFAVQDSHSCRDVCGRFPLGTLNVNWQRTRRIALQLCSRLTSHRDILSSGILADWQGNTSPQLDLVLTVDSSLPVIAMREGVALIPFDSALLAIEIKSTLDSSVLDQLQKQNASIATAVLSNVVPPGTRFIIPTMVVAMEDSKLSADTMSSWMLSNPNTVACCVVGKYFLRLEGQTTVRIDNGRDDRFRETMHFIECIYESIKHLQSNRTFDPRWASFLLS